MEEILIAVAAYFLLTKKGTKTYPKPELNPGVKTKPKSKPNYNYSTE